MSASFEWVGLSDLLSEILRLPDDLQTEARAIVHQHAEDAKAEAFDGYPNRTGDLRSQMDVIDRDRGEYVAAAVLVNRSPVAGIFENGSRTRQTKLGADRGSMPPGHVFVPAVIRARRAMYDDLKALLVAHGLEARGDA